MTENSELAAAQKHSENSLRMFVATAEGYQTLAEEKTDFRRSVCEGEAVVVTHCSPPKAQEEDPQSTAVPSQQILHSDAIEMEPETMETKSLTEYFSKMHMDATMPNCQRQRRPNELESSLPDEGADDVTQMKMADPNRDEPHLTGTYSGFNAHDSHQFEMERMSLPFHETSQRWQQMAENKAAGRPPPEYPQECGALPGADQAMAKGERLDESAPAGLCKYMRSPAKESYGPEQAPIHPAEQQQQQLGKAAPTEPDVARLYEYHLAKRMSSLQSEGIHSLQSSQCSSIDAGCSTGSSSCVTPMDSPLCIADSTHLLSESSLKGLGYGTPEEKAYAKPPHPNMDPSLVRKVHAQPGTEPPFGTIRDGCHRMPKIRETTGIPELHFLYRMPSMYTTYCI